MTGILAKLQPRCVTLCLQLACFSFASGHVPVYVFSWYTQLLFFSSASCAKIHLAANTCQCFLLQIFSTTRTNVTAHPAFTPVARVVSTIGTLKIKQFFVRNSCTCTSSCGNYRFMPCCDHDTSHCANTWHAFLLPAVMC
jgi:hypothetical protein